MDEAAGTTFDRELGAVWDELSAEHATGRLAVEPRHLQPGGVVHGGVYCTLAETVASAATFGFVSVDGMVALGQSNETSFLRPIGEGSIHVEALRRHGGRTSWLWDVEMSDDEGRLCALSRVLIAIRPAR